MKRDVKKYCPKCGVENNISDAYCINCGFSFVKRKKKKINWVLAIILILIFLWIFYTTLTKQALIPEKVTDLLKGFNFSKVKN